MVSFNPKAWLNLREEDRHAWIPYFGHLDQRLRYNFVTRSAALSVLSYHYLTSEPAGSVGQFVRQ